MTPTFKDSVHRGMTKSVTRATGGTGATSKLNQLLQSEGLQEELSDCENLSLCQGDQDTIINVSYLKEGHRKRRNADREIDITNLGIQSNSDMVWSVIRAKKVIAESMKNILGEKFVHFVNAVFTYMH